VRIDKKYLLRFTPSNFQEPVSYELVKRFDIVPNILRAQVDENGGGLILEMNGRVADIEEAKVYMEGLGIGVKALDKHIDRDESRCTHCGSCVSICPTKAFVVNRRTWEVEFESELCIACESCLSACPPRAMMMKPW